MILSDTVPNRHYKITDFNRTTDIRRFLDLGIIRGATITRLFNSPFGDPTAFLINETVIALRHTDSKCINVIGCESDD